MVTPTVTYLGRNLQPTDKQVADARRWAADCEWLEGSLEGLSAREMVRGVDRHYDGGWAQFVRDSA